MKKTLLFIVLLINSATILSQLPDFFYQLPYQYKLNETDESAIIDNKNLILDTFDYNILYSKKNRYEVDYRLYRWECELYCYIDTATKKLTGIKIWNTPENWESNGIKIDMTENDFLNYLKSSNIQYSSYKCEYFNDYTIKTKQLAFSFSFPADDETSQYQVCWSDHANKLQYVYASAIRPKQKGKTLTVTY